MFPTVLFIWVICAVVAVIAANSKGRDPLAWGVIGFLFGPLGALVAVAVPESEPGKEKQGLQTGALKTCPRCAESVKPQAQVCKHCGHEFGSPLPEDAAAHRALQSAIAANDIDTVRQLIRNGLVLASNPLPISHLEYAEMQENAEAVELLAYHLESQAHQTT